MLSKKEIKDIQSLSQKKAREESGFFLAEGPKIVSELLLAMPRQVHKVYALESWLKANSGAENFSLEIISEAELQRLSQLQTPNQVLAVLKQSAATEPIAAQTFCLYLDGIQDPGNMGTIIRIADWFGVPHLVCTKECADRYNPKVVQASMASIARVNVFYDEEKTWLRRQKTDIYAAVLGGASVYQQQKVSNGVLIIGNEGKGISDAVLSFANRHITIPKKGEAESLNAAVATGIILSHLL